MGIEILKIEDFLIFFPRINFLKKGDEISNF